MVSPWAVGACIGVLGAALGGMGLSWRARTLRGAVALPPTPEDLGTPLVRAEGLYLATTRVDRPLERVMAGGLGFRAHAVLSASDRGVLLERTGSAPIFLDRDRLQGVGAATWTIDRAVEPEGLTVLRWRLGDGDDAELVESSLRLPPDERRALALAFPPRDPHGDA